MRFQKVLFILTAFLLINIFTQTSAFCSDKWFKVRTKNFTLIGNAKEKDIKKVGVKLEQFRESIKRLVPKLSKNSPISTTVIVFKNNKSFHPYKPVNADGKITDWVAGYFQAGFDINYIALAFDNNGADAYQTIFHEYTHNLIDYNFGRKVVPTWLNEGLAEYYDQFSVKNDRIVRFGGRNLTHIKLLKENDLIPLKNFFDTDYKSLRLKNQNEANQFYSQAWALTHFFIRGENGRWKANFDKYIELILDKVSAEKAFEKAFPFSFVELQSKLENHIESKNIGSTTLKFDTKLTGQIPSRAVSLSKSEVQANLGDLFYQRLRFKEAEAHLQNALKLKPDLSFANSTLGLIRMKQERYDEAAIFLKRSTKAENADYLIHYRYAYFLSREVMTLNTYVSNYDDERTEAMRVSLRKSIELNANFPDSHRLYGFINLVRNENLDEGISHLRKALGITPNKQAYMLDLANLYLRNKDLSNAAAFAEEVVKDPEDDHLENSARIILNNVARIKNELALAQNEETESGRRIPKSFDNLVNRSRALTEAELERNRRQTENEAISEVLRKPKSGEKRIVGAISSVNCKNNQVIFNVTVDQRTHTFKNSDFSKIRLRTFTPEMSNGLLGCDMSSENISAVLIYKPAIGKTDELLGEVVSIEFVPKDFVLAIKKK